MSPIAKLLIGAAIGGGLGAAAVALMESDGDGPTRRGAVIATFGSAISVVGGILLLVDDARKKAAAARMGRLRGA